MHTLPRLANTPPVTKASRLGCPWALGRHLRHMAREGRTDSVRSALSGDVISATSLVRSDVVDRLPVIPSIDHDVGSAAGAALEIEQCREFLRHLTDTGYLTGDRLRHARRSGGSLINALTADIFQPAEEAALSFIKASERLCNDYPLVPVLPDWGCDIHVEWAGDAWIFLPPHAFWSDFPDLYSELGVDLAVLIADVFDLVAPAGFLRLWDAYSEMMEFAFFVEEVGDALDQLAANSGGLENVYQALRRKGEAAVAGDDFLSDINTDWLIEFIELRLGQTVRARLVNHRLDVGLPSHDDVLARARAMDHPVGRWAEGCLALATNVEHHDWPDDVFADGPLYWGGLMVGIFHHLEYCHYEDIAEASMQAEATVFHMDSPNPLWFGERVVEWLLIKCAAQSLGRIVYGSENY